MTTFPPVSRRTDPRSSFLAEQGINEDGSRESQQQFLLRLVKHRPGLTSMELSKLCELDRYQVARRLADLKNGKLLESGYIRNCTVSDKEAVTWNPILVERQLQLL